YDLDVRSADGHLDRRIRVNVPRRPVTAAMRETDIRTRLAQLAGFRERPRDPAEAERLTREAPFSDSLPAFDQLLIDRTGNLWVLDPFVAGDTAWSASVFRRDGRLVGRLTAATSGRPVHFGPEHVVLRHVDSDGVVSYAVHRIGPVAP